MYQLEPIHGNSEPRPDKIKIKKQVNKLTCQVPGANNASHPEITPTVSGLIHRSI